MHRKSTEISEKGAAGSTGHMGKEGREIFEEEMSWVLEDQWPSSRQTALKVVEKRAYKQQSQLTAADSITVHGTFRKQ